MTTDPEFSIPDVPASNLRHDQEHGNPYAMSRIRCAWLESHMMRRGKLTDRKIAQYEREGFYSVEYKAARKELQERKAKKRSNRDGNFVLEGGRMIYDPK